MRKKGGIFERWLSDFAMAVFTQSLHAIMMAFIMIALSAVMSGGSSPEGEGEEITFNVPSSVSGGESTTFNVDGEQISQSALAPLVSFLAFFGVTGITRFEKSVKQIFGIGESSFLKGTRENAAKTAMAMKSGMNMARNSVAAAKAGRDGLKKMSRLKQDKKFSEALKSGKLKMGGAGYVSVTGDVLNPSDSGGENGQDSAPANSAASLSNSSKGNVNEITRSALESKRKSLLADSDRLNKEADELTSKLNNGQIPKGKIQETRALREEKLNAAAKLDLDAQAIERQLKNKQYKLPVTPELHPQASYDKAIAHRNLYANKAIEAEKSGDSGSQARYENMALRAEERAKNIANAHSGVVREGQGAPAPENNSPQSSGASTGTTSQSSGAVATNKKGNTYLEQLQIEDYEERKREKEEAKYTKMADEWNAANRDVRKAFADSVFNIGSTVAGLGVGAGMDNDLSDIMNIANVISDPIVKKSTEKLIRRENKKMQKDAYQIAKDTGGVEAVMKVNISPEFVNDATLTSAIIGGLERKIKGVSNKNINLGTTSVNATQNVNVNKQNNVNVNSTQNVNVNSTQNVVHNVKNTKNTPLKTLKHQTNVYRGNYVDIDSVDNI